MKLRIECDVIWTNDQIKEWSKYTRDYYITGNEPCGFDIENTIESMFVHLNDAIISETIVAYRNVKFIGTVE